VQQRRAGVEHAQQQRERDEVEQRAGEAEHQHEAAHFGHVPAMARMVAASIHSPMKTEITAPNTRISTNGLANWRASRCSTCVSRCGSTRLGPSRASRAAASALLRPSSARVPNCASSERASRLQYGAAGGLGSTAKSATPAPRRH
jgi:hypothetical protein